MVVIVTIDYPYRYTLLTLGHMLGLVVLGGAMTNVATSGWSVDVTDILVSPRHTLLGPVLSGFLLVDLY